MSSPLFSLKRALLGRRMATAEETHERLAKKIALPVFSSDAISSTAYATEEILLVLVAAGAAALQYALPISIAVAVLLFIVVFSYRQTVHAYPAGGGSYVVASDNLGAIPGLVAGASLLIDYVLTVAVSMSSGVAAITSAFPSLYPHRVLLALLLVVLVAVVNLRGLRESGAVFAIPTYSFVVLCGGLVLVGAFRWATGTLEPVVPTEVGAATSTLTLFLVLRAFAGGCSAMTGTEAISNGVPAFKAPESHNAAVTLVIMAVILAFLFVGITALSLDLDVVPREGDTVLSQVGRAVYGNGGFLYLCLQVATMLILVLASNTSFNGLPRLAAVLAEHGYLPRQLMHRGDRLVYSNGIVVLALVAMIVIAVFGADTHRLIPLYAVGVFTGFTLSQAGMVRRWQRVRGDHWHYKAFVNGFGAVATGVVAVVIVTAKFTHGAYLVVIAVPVIVAFCWWVKRHYDEVAAVLEPGGAADLARLGRLARERPRTTVVLFVAQVNELTARSLSFARALAPDDVHAVTVKGDEARLLRLHRAWGELDVDDVPLRVVESPYRELVRPAVRYVRGLKPGPDHMVTVVIPEFVVRHWWEAFLHNQNALRLKGALFLVPWVVVLSVPFHLGVPVEGDPGASGPVSDDPSP